MVESIFRNTRSIPALISEVSASAVSCSAASLVSARQSVVTATTNGEESDESEESRECGLLPDAFLGEQPMQLIDAGDGVTVERNDDVSLSQAAFCRRAVGFDRH